MGDCAQQHRRHLLHSHLNLVIVFTICYRYFRLCIVRWVFCCTHTHTHRQTDEDAHAHELTHEGAPLRSGWRARAECARRNGGRRGVVRCCVVRRCAAWRAGWRGVAWRAGQCSAVAVARTRGIAASCLPGFERIRHRSRACRLDAKPRSAMHGESASMLLRSCCPVCILRVLRVPVQLCMVCQLCMACGVWADGKSPPVDACILARLSVFARLARESQT